ncbi:MAG TPA: ComEC/Rec2 family competence protein [Acidimicrobiales bacterium]|nr:ComEC/Rec2 family competence protein [Acidimicrobiales bacterium]
MTDAAVVVMALATALGAWMARPVPVALAVAVVAVAFVRRRPALLVFGALLLASGLAARSWHGLHEPVGNEVTGTAVVVTDPVEALGAVRAEVRIDGRRYDAWARGAAASALRPLLAGERIRVTGRLRPVTGRARSYLARRHVAARLEMGEAEPAGRAHGPAHLANQLRRLLDHGSRGLGDRDRGLFAGFVLGDDRGQDAVTVDDFRSAGLSHLLVVSGQNVAFVLALAAPLVRRGPLVLRVVGGLAVLALFGLLTRWEPSVLRAEAMAALGLVGAAVARPVSSIRLLALAVTGVLLVDPLLVGSVGFLLSVSACAGIALLSRPLTGWLRGPEWVRAALGVTLAAQAGVAPVLATVFGGIPVAALPANLLALPVAGPIMVWGMSAGLLAGLLGGGVAAVLHVPTRLGIGWTAGVARAAAGLPLGTLTGRHLVVGAGVVVVAAAIPRWRRGAVLALALLVCLPALTARWPGDGEIPVPGGRLDRRHGVVTLTIDAPSPRLLGALRARAVRRIDVLVLSGPGARLTATTIASRIHVRRLVIQPRVGEKSRP